MTGAIRRARAAKSGIVVGAGAARLGFGVELSGRSETDGACERVGVDVERIAGGGAPAGNWLPELASCAAVLFVGAMAGGVASNTKGLPGAAPAGAWAACSGAARNANRESASPVAGSGGGAASRTGAVVPSWSEESGGFVRECW
jgi:hypothetical protein